MEYISGSVKLLLFTKIVCEDIRGGIRDGDPGQAVSDMHWSRNTYSTASRDMAVLMPQMLARHGSVLRLPNA